MNKSHCTVCGAQTDGTPFCSGLCESEYHEVMGAMDILQEDPSKWIEAYADSFYRQYPKEMHHIVEKVLARHGVTQ